MANQPSCLIVDDHPSIAHCTARFLEEAGVRTQCVETLEEGHRLLARLQPDLAIVDWNLDDGSGLTLLEVAASLSPRTACVVFSAFPSFGLITRARELGARAVCTKRVHWIDLRNIFLAVLRGAGWILDPECAELARRESLTADERQLLAKLALGEPISAIAQTLGVDPSTLSRRQQRIGKHYPTGTPLELVDSARRAGVLPDPWERKLLR